MQLSTVMTRTYDGYGEAEWKEKKKRSDTGPQKCQEFILVFYNTAGLSIATTTSAMFQNIF